MGRVGRQGSLPLWPLIRLSPVPAGSAGVTSSLAAGQTIPNTGWVGRGHFQSDRWSDYPQYRLGRQGSFPVWPLVRLSPVPAGSAGVILCRRRTAFPFRIVVILFIILFLSHRHLNKYCVYTAYMYYTNCTMYNSFRSGQMWSNM